MSETPTTSSRSARTCSSSPRHGLLVATVAGAFMPLGVFHLPVALTIAGIKAALIIMYFMHVRYSSKLIWVFSTAAFFWLSILLVFSLSDYFTRGWIDVPGK